jgi:hypothetical protein
MTSDNNGIPQNERRGRTTNGSLGPTAPIIIVAMIVFFAVNGHESASGREGLTTDPVFSSSAILGGVERHISSSAFRSAEASAFMGGVTLDFREAVMEGSEARVEVSAVMGGIDIRVPRTWTVVNRVTPILGGVDDHTHSTGSGKRLVIEGTVLMGGLDIKN